MKRDVLFAAMDVIKEMDNLEKQIAQKSGSEMTEEARKGYEYAKLLLNSLLNETITDAEESCVVHINGLEQQEEMFKSDIFKYLDEHSGFLPEIQG